MNDLNLLPPPKKKLHKQFNMKQAHGIPETGHHIPENHLLRPDPALWFYKSISFTDITAGYFHFPLELSGNA